MPLRFLGLCESGQRRVWKIVPISFSLFVEFIVRIQPPTLGTLRHGLWNTGDTKVKKGYSARKCPVKERVKGENYKYSMLAARKLEVGQGASVRVRAV